MNRRNWLQLSRKLVDRYDMDYTVGALQAALGQTCLAFFGEGVLPTTQYPVPFPLTMSTTALGGSVGDGIAFDPQGQITEIPSAPGTSPVFTISPADTVNPRYDLLVLRYKSTGEVTIPQPSDPLLTTTLNLVDDFALVVLPGTASSIPAYPAKGSLDIILCGLQVPANATLGSQVTVDLSVRDIAAPFQMTKVNFVQERPTGIVDGVNNTFLTSQLPRDAQSLKVYVDDLLLPLNQWTLSGQSISFGSVLQLGQSPYVEYIVQDLTSQNPLAGAQEVPSGVVDGVNGIFTLTGMPYDKPSTNVYIDGKISTSEKWNLVSGSIQSQIVFTGANIPAQGQDVYVTYSKNVAPSQTTISSGGGGSGGTALMPYGSPEAPVIVAPATGIEVNNVPRQLIFCQPSAGSGGEEISEDPQISVGSAIGQELILVGTSDSDYLILEDGNGLALNGPASLKNNVQIYLIWNGSVWMEVSRR